MGSLSDSVKRGTLPTGICPSMTSYAGDRASHAVLVGKCRRLSQAAGVHKKSFLCIAGFPTARLQVSGGRTGALLFLHTQLLPLSFATVQGRSLSFRPVRKLGAEGRFPVTRQHGLL